MKIRLQGGQRTPSPRDKDADLLIICYNPFSSPEAVDLGAIARLRLDIEGPAAVATTRPTTSLGRLRSFTSSKRSGEKVPGRLRSDSRGSAF